VSIVGLQSRFLYLSDTIVAAGTLWSWHMSTVTIQANSDATIGLGVIVDFHFCVDSASPFHF